MAAYERFARIYDELMEDISYALWIEYIENIFKAYNISPKLVLDLGCGSGKLTTGLAQKGYDMIGVDLSQDMLLRAKDKAKANNLEILYLNQDMTEFELYGTVGAIVSTCDSLNYILEQEDLLKTFKLVHNYLDPGGLFIFDVNTIHKFKNTIGDETFAENYEDFSYIWENHYDDESSIHEYFLTIFMEEDGVYHKSEEVHYERAYDLDIIKDLIQEAGLVLEEVFSENKNDNIETADRVFFVARKGE